MTNPTNGNTPKPAFPARADDQSVPWARQSGTKERTTGRNRRMVRDLPGWDPLPPGEILVQRRRRA